MSESYQALIETLYQARLENRRLRISQLRRMANEADAQRDDLIGYRITEDAPIGSFLWRMARRKWWLAKFVAACLAEIERLRGEG